MTKAEYSAWLKETESSRYTWKMDTVLWENSKTLLVYIGGADAGRYVQVDAAGMVSIGSYTGAIPCITDACFTVRWSKKFDDQSAAITRAIEVGGMAFLRAFLGV